MANLILTNTADNNKDKTTRLIGREGRIETQTWQEPIKHDNNSQPKNQGTYIAKWFIYYIKFRTVNSLAPRNTWRKETKYHDWCLEKQK